MKIGIIGAGKVGTAMGTVLKQQGFPIVAISDMSDASLERAKVYIGPGPLYTTENREVVERADVIAVTTQDGVISQVAGKIAHSFPSPLAGKLFFHTSGAHPSSILKPLDAKGALLGSLHPLQTFPDVESAIAVFAQTFIFIEGDVPALPILDAIGGKIGAKVVRIEAKDKVLYHLAAVFVCNLLSALLYSGEGIMEKIDIGIEPFFPIIRATLRNIENKGPLMSLTGPIVRGDVDTVAAHIEAMAGMAQHKEVYKALSRVAIDMVAQRGLLGETSLAPLRSLLDEIH
jgi:predicted short-subunit dehydrogenase-like oxidoreductase (DUF2520 family)